MDAAKEHVRPLQSSSPRSIFLPPEAFVNSIIALIRRGLHGTIARARCGRRPAGGALWPPRSPGEIERACREPPEPTSAHAGAYLFNGGHRKSEPLQSRIPLSALTFVSKIFLGTKLTSMSSRRNVPTDPEVVRRMRSSARYQRWRASILRDEPSCRPCAASGFTVGAEHIDHIEPVHLSPERFWDRTNIQPLCRDCHGEQVPREATHPRAAP